MMRRKIECKVGPATISRARGKIQKGATCFLCPVLVGQRWREVEWMIVMRQGRHFCLLFLWLCLCLHHDPSYPCSCPSQGFGLCLCHDLVRDVEVLLSFPSFPSLPPLPSFLSFPSFPSADFPEYLSENSLISIHSTRTLKSWSAISVLIALTSAGCLDISASQFASCNT